MHAMQGRRIYGDTRSRRPPLGIMLGVLLLLATWLIGGAALGPPLAQVEAALRYEPVPATLDAARLVGVSRDGRTTWHPEVLFRYRVGELTRESRRYAWVPPAFRERADGAELVAALQADDALTAWVDPDEPGRAVLDAGLPPWRIWLDCAPWLASGLLGLAEGGGESRPRYRCRGGLRRDADADRRQPAARGPVLRADA